MSDQHQTCDEPLTPSAVQRLDKACDRFEAAWRNAPAGGQRPRIEDFLDTVPEPERPALTRELIALDMDYRGRAGEKPQIESYLERFPFLGLAQLGGTLAAKLVAGYGPGPSGLQTADFADVEAKLDTPGTRIRCPHCHNPITPGR